MKHKEEEEERKKKERKPEGITREKKESIRKK